MFDFDGQDLQDVAKWICLGMVISCSVIATKDVSCLWFLLIGVFI